MTNLKKKLILMTHEDIIVETCRALLQKTVSVFTDKIYPLYFSILAILLSNIDQYYCNIGIGIVL